MSIFVSRCTTALMRGSCGYIPLNMNNLHSILHGRTFSTNPVDQPCSIIIEGVWRSNMTKEELIQEIQTLEEGRCPTVRIMRKTKFGDCLQTIDDLEKDKLIEYLKKSDKTDKAS